MTLKQRNARADCGGEVVLGHARRGRSRCGAKEVFVWLSS